MMQLYILRHRQHLLWPFRHPCGIIQNVTQTQLEACLANTLPCQHCLLIIFIVPEPAPVWAVRTVMNRLRVPAARARHKAPIAPGLWPPVGLMQHHCGRHLLLLWLLICVFFPFLLWERKQTAAAPRGAMHVVCCGLCVSVRHAACVTEGAAAKAAHMVTPLYALNHVTTAL